MSTPLKSIELLKHQLTLELEARKWDYRKLELQYLEAGQHLRSLNQLMWQVPGMAIAITGGLWFGATTIEANLPKTWVFVFAAIVDALTIVVLLRLRERIQIQIDHQSNLTNQPANKDPRKGTVVKCWIFALFAAAVVSGLGAVYPEALAKTQTPEKSNMRHEVIVQVSPQQCIAQYQWWAPIVALKAIRPCTP